MTDAEILAKLKALINKQTDAISKQTETIAKLSDILTQLQSTMTVTANIFQGTAPEAKILVFGQDYAVALIDEGTEGNASEYSITGGFGGTITDEAIIVQVGVQSLRLTADVNPALSLFALRQLSEPFLWGDFITSTIWIYRSAVSVTGIMIILAKTTASDDGMRAWPTIDLTGQTVGTWQQYILTRGDSYDTDGVVATTDIINYMILYWRTEECDPLDTLYLDGYYINAGTASTVAMNVDDEGHLQTDLNPLTGIAGHGQKIVGGTAVQLSASSIPCSSVCVKAMSTNSDIVYVGKDDDVTTGNGFELTAGEAKTYDVDDVQDLWFIADAASQKVCWDAI